MLVAVVTGPRCFVKLCFMWSAFLWLASRRFSFYRAFFADSIIIFAGLSKIATLLYLKKSSGSFILIFSLAPETTAFPLSMIFVSSAFIYFCVSFPVIFFSCLVSNFVTMRAIQASNPQAFSIWHIGRTFSSVLLFASSDISDCDRAWCALS